MHSCCRNSCFNSCMHDLGCTFHNSHSPPSYHLHQHVCIPSHTSRNCLTNRNKSNNKINNETLQSFSTAFTLKEPSEPLINDHICHHHHHMPVFGNFNPLFFYPSFICPLCMFTFNNLCQNCKKFPCKCCKNCNNFPCKCCQNCKKLPCECCKNCKKFPCECCKNCNNFPCKCCKTCNKYPCICCKNCKSNPCKCCTKCHNYPCNCHRDCNSNYCRCTGIREYFQPLQQIINPNQINIPHNSRINPNEINTNFSEINRQTSIFVNNYHIIKIPFKIFNVCRR